MGLAISKGLIIDDHRKVLWCKKHSCIINTQHISTCDEFNVDWRTIGWIRVYVLRGKENLDHEELSFVCRKLEDIHEQLIDGMCKGNVEKVIKGEANERSLKE